MEDMNMTEMVTENNTTMETPVFEGEVVESKGGILKVALAATGVTLMAVGAKVVIKKVAGGVKNFFNKRKKDVEVEVVETETTEVECVEED